MAAAPPDPQGKRIEALTYFVNELRAGRKSTPYSMVTAEPAPTGFLPADLKDSEIVVNEWLAKDLSAEVGGTVAIKYFVSWRASQLTEKPRRFHGARILLMIRPGLDTSWMPDFPGLSDKKSCRDWQPGFAFDSTRMREKDQEYWEKYQGTPKAFVNLHVARRCGRIAGAAYPSAGRKRHGSRQDQQAANWC